jgi:hypothetical protein
MTVLLLALVLVAAGCYCIDRFTKMPPARTFDRMAMVWAWTGISLMALAMAAVVWWLIVGPLARR